MTAVHPCPKCGAALPKDTTARQCPKCLLAVFAGEPSLGGETQRAGEGEGAVGRARGRVRCFGDYELEGEIASGGMGVVYFARQVSLNRNVALKLIRSGTLATAPQVQRFRTEAEAAASLNHPNIVPIHEVGEHEGQHYFSMTLVEGGSLAELIASTTVRDRRWLKRSARFVGTLARAVHHAHQRGVLHRDIKPTNILLDDNGEPYLTDFGLAKLAQTGRDLTQTIAILGTPHYMAPEQAAGKNREVTTAADIYGLGAVLFEMISGRPVFQGDSALEVLKRAQEEEPPSLRKLNATVDRDLETICRKCLEKEPAHRYDTAEALAEDLERWLAGGPIQARAVTPFERVSKWSRRNPAVATLIVLAHVLFVAGVIGVLWQWRRAETNAGRAETTARENQQRLVRLNVNRGAGVLEEGDNLRSMLLFAEALQLEDVDEAAQEQHQFRLGSILHQSPRLLNVWFPGRADGRALFSPDGKSILILAGAETALFDAATFKPSPVSFATGSVVLGFTPDSRQLVLRGTNAILLLDRVSGRITLSLEHRRVRGARFCADGSRLATYASDGTVRIWNPTNGALASPVLRHAAAAQIVELSRDGRQVAIGDQSGLVTLREVASGRSVFPPLRGKKSIWSLRFHADSRRLVTIFEDEFGVGLWDAGTGAPASPRLDHDYWVTDAIFSADGKRVLTCGWDRLAKIWESVSGRLLVPLAGHTKAVLGGQFSQDGRQVLTRGFDGSARVWDAETGTLRVAPLWHGASVNSAHLDPTGTRALTAGMDGVVRLWALDPHARPFVPWVGTPPRILLSSTRTGRLITQNNAGLIEVWHPADRSASGALARHWVIDAWVSPDEQRLLAVSYQDGKNRDTLELETWELPSGRLLHHATAPGRPRNLIYANRDATHVAVCSGNTIEVREAATGSLVATLEHPDRPTFVVFDPAMERMVARTRQRVHVWDLSTGQPACPPLELQQDVFSVAFSRDARQVLISCSDNTFEPKEARLWDIETGRLAVPPLKHGDGVWFASFSPDGSRIVTCSEDETARLWDVRTGQPLCAPMEHRRTVRHASFSPDGRKLVTGSVDRTVRVWDVATGEPLTPPLPHEDRVERVFFADEGRTIVAFIGDLNIPNAVCWSLAGESRSADDWRDIARLLSGHSIDPTGGFAPVNLETLSNLWANLTARYPEDFGGRPSPPARAGTADR